MAESSVRLSDDSCAVPMEWVQNASVHQLVEKCTGEKTPADKMEYYQVIHLELSERIKESHQACSDTAKEIFKLLPVENSIRVQQLVQLMDFCSKNSSVLFLKALSSKPFVNPVLNQLKIVRGKINKVKLKLLSRPVRLRREETEKTLLSLIQMWADTFMMKEDQFPGFLTIYRQLRKEGIEFPPRDPNLRMLMENNCSDSPMFDFVEQAAGREVRVSIGGSSMAPEKQESSQDVAPTTAAGTKKKQSDAEKVTAFAAQFEGDFGEIEFNDLEENIGDARDLMRMQLTVQDSEMVKQSLEILDDLRMGAETVHELRSEIAVEIYETCAYIQKKSQKIVEAKLNALDSQGGQVGTSEVDVAGYLTMIDSINAKLIIFKQRYANLKEKAITEFKQHLMAKQERKESAAELEGQKKKSSKRQQSSSSDSSSSSSDLSDDSEDSYGTEKVPKSHIPIDQKKLENKKKREAAAAADQESAQASALQEEEKKSESSKASAVPKKAQGLAKPPGGLRKLRAPPTSNLNNLRNIRDKLQNKQTEDSTQAAQAESVDVAQEPVTASDQQDPAAQKVTYDLIDL